MKTGLVKTGKVIDYSVRKKKKKEKSHFRSKRNHFPIEVIVI